MDLSNIKLIYIPFYFQLIIFSALEDKHFKESFYAPSKKYTVDFPKPKDGGRLAYIGLETKHGSFFDVYLGQLDILKIEPLDTISHFQIISTFTYLFKLSQTYIR